jgi:hypothetical protein
MIHNKVDQRMAMMGNSEITLKIDSRITPNQAGVSNVPELLRKDIQRQLGQ